VWIAVPVASRSGATLRISAAPTEGGSVKPAAGIIIIIWWTNIAWLSQIRPARSRTAWAMCPAIATLRPTALKRRRGTLQDRRTSLEDRLRGGPGECGAFRIGSISAHLGRKSERASHPSIMTQAGNQLFGQEVIDA
jgi:hypothetical protein